MCVKQLLVVPRNPVTQNIAPFALTQSLLLSLVLLLPCVANGHGRLTAVAHIRTNQASRIPKYGDYGHTMIEMRFHLVHVARGSNTLCSKDDAQSVVLNLSAPYASPLPRVRLECAAGADGWRFLGTLRP